MNHYLNLTNRLNENGRKVLKKLYQIDNFLFLMIF